ncbi:MAG: FtsW/RodA/SpoVE family cell cycle protein, partial [Thermoplasmata archaeon]|nr:FtsW/RodA/SpoVE family cell cycle protein [Thermoplasmata archaeon]
LSQYNYQVERLRAFMNPFAYRQNIGYQQCQSLLALGSGGPFGVGLGMSAQKLYFLPLAYNDFTASIIGEEFGFVGFSAILTLYAAFMVVGFRIALKTKKLPSHLLAMGITTLITIQAIIHMGVSCGMLPATGLNLPFVSFGGTSMLMNFAGVGILLNIVRSIPAQRRKKVERLTERSRRLAIGRG